MPIRVQMPDGNVAEFPDGMSNEQIEGVLHQHYASAPQQQAAPKPLAQIKASQPNRGAGGWLSDLQEDLMHGGGRTAVGRVMGQMQGRGDKGYGGMASGTTEGTANYVGSLPLGLVKMAQAGPEAVQGHVIPAIKKLVGGAAQAATIPSAFLGTPELGGAIDAAEQAAPRAAASVWAKLPTIPTRARAGAMLNQVGEKVGNAPVQFTQSTPLIEKAQRLSDYGHGTITPLDKLYQRMQTINPISYEEARGRYTPLTRLTANDKMNATPQLQAAAKQVAHAMRQDIGQAAQNAGVGELYQRGMDMYRQASRNADVAKKAIKYGIPALIGAGAASQGRKILDMFGK